MKHTKRLEENCETDQISEVFKGKCFKSKLIW